MSVFEYYYKNIVKQDLVTRFSFDNLAQIPRFQKICLHFQVSQSSLRQLLPLMSAMSMLSLQKPFLCTSNRVNLVLRMKKGLPIGCMVSLRGEAMYNFMERLLFVVLPQFKGSSCPVLKIGEKNAFLTLEHLFFFKEIEKEYENFQDLPQLSITMVLSSVKREEISALFTALKFPVKNNNKND